MNKGLSVSKPLNQKSKADTGRMAARIVSSRKSENNIEHG